LAKYYGFTDEELEFISNYDSRRVSAGSIENRNGILRGHFPEKHNWNLTSQKQIDKVVSKINLTPMKYLGYKTPFVKI
jgi:IS30 family transposase